MSQRGAIPIVCPVCKGSGWRDGNAPEWLPDTPRKTGGYHEVHARFLVALHQYFGSRSFTVSEVNRALRDASDCGFKTTVPPWPALRRDDEGGVDPVALGRFFSGLCDRWSTASDVHVSRDRTRRGSVTYWCVVPNRHVLR